MSSMEVIVTRQQQRDGNGDARTKARAERKSRSVMLHGFGGAALRVFGTYVVDGEGAPRNIIVRAYHKESGSAPWQPSDATVLRTIDELEDEIRDWELRATAVGYKRLSKRIGAHGAFAKDSIPAPPKPPRPGVFTKSSLPDPLSIKHGGGGPSGARRGRK